LTAEIMCDQYTKSECTAKMPRLVDFESGFAYHVSDSLKLQR